MSNSWNKKDVQFFGVLCALLGFGVGVLGTLFVQELISIFSI
jgi:hypothetical protein